LRSSWKPSYHIDVKLVEREVALDVSDEAWAAADAIRITTYWSGETAPEGRHFTARLLWSASAFYVLFEGNQAEPLVIAEEPDLSRKTIGLWERDVCEIFVAPDRSEPRRYFEFEAAPTGEWLDLKIDLTSGERVTDWDYHSGMEVAARVEEGRVKIAMRIPWEAFGGRPEPGDVWLGNIFRCVGKGPDRGYLAWRPTMTDEPQFHVPEAFGEFRFVKE
jgi:alpha-galactosidase